MRDHNSQWRRGISERSFISREQYTTSLAFCQVNSPKSRRPIGITARSLAPSKIQEWTRSFLANMWHSSSSDIPKEPNRELTASRLTRMLSRFESGLLSTNRPPALLIRQRRDRLKPSVG